QPGTAALVLCHRAAADAEATTSAGEDPLRRRNRLARIRGPARRGPLRGAGSATERRRNRRTSGNLGPAPGCRMNSRPMTRLWLMLALLTGLSGLSGCSLRNWLFPPPFSDRAPCAISPSISKDQLVAHLNRNIQGSATTSGIAAWRSTNAKITATGMPPGISVPATIAVEAPRNFRLRVSEPLTRVEALDMGSNRQEFWFWARDAQPPQVVTISH